MYKIRGADDKEYGPVSADQIRHWIAEHRLDARSAVQQVGSDVWRPLREYPEFSSSLGAPPPPRPPAPHGSVPASTPRPGVAGGTAHLSGLAIAAFVLGLLGFCTFFTAIPGLILGAVALRKIRRNPGQLRGRGLAMAGLALSLLTLILVPGIMLPMMKKHSRMHRGGGGGDPTSECLSHLQELSRTVRMYANDNNDFFPPASTWCDAIQRDLLDSGVFQCPLRPGQRSGFAFNVALAGRKDQEIDPNMVMLFESDAGWNMSGGAEAVVKPPRHRGSILVAFADGSVREVAASEVANLRWTP